MSEKLKTPTPKSFQGELETPSIEVLPLIPRKPKLDEPSPGWCTYLYAEESPDTEFISGGINDKTPRAAALWRQGHLFHFGFDALPKELNSNGRNLLINAICYIYRFDRDRPIAFTPSVFVSKTSKVKRRYVDAALKKNKPVRETLTRYLGEKTMASIKDLTGASVVAWYSSRRGRLAPDHKTGRLELDADLELLGASYDDMASLVDVARGLRKLEAEGVDADDETRQRSAAARRVLKRYLPEGPDVDAGGADWLNWIKSIRQHAFFSELGGCRWHIDPMGGLEGSARATRPGPKALNR